MTNKIKTKEYEIDYEKHIFGNNRYIAVISITIKKPIEDAIIIPSKIAGLEVWEYYDDIQFLDYSKKTDFKIVLPNTIRTISNDPYETSYGELVLPYPSNLVYDDTGYLRGKYNSNIKYCRSCLEINEDYLEEDFYLSNDHKLKYLGYIINNDSFFMDLYYQGINHYFKTGIYKTDDFSFDYYVYNNNAYIYKIYQKNPSQRNLFIPNTVLFDNCEIKVIGLGFNCLENIDVLNIIFNDNLNYISFYLNCNYRSRVFINNIIDSWIFDYQYPLLYLPNNRLTNKFYLYDVDTNKKVITGNIDIELIDLKNPYYNIYKDLFMDKEPYQVQKITFNRLDYKDSNISFYNLSYKKYDIVYDDIFTYVVFEELNRASIILINDDNYHLNDLIIPDNVLYNNKLYPVTKINEIALISNKNYNQVIIGENIESIEKDAIKIKHCNEIIFKGRKISKIKEHGLGINISKSRLILPNSLAFLGEYFMNGDIDYLSFEDNSKLLRIDNNCFSDFKRIFELVLPHTLLSIGSFRNNIGRVYFTEGHLNIIYFRGTNLPKTFYENGMYLGTLSNPYAMCVGSYSGIIHKDCYRVFDVNDLNNYPNTIEYCYSSDDIIPSDYDDYNDIEIDFFSDDYKIDLMKDLKNLYDQYNKNYDFILKTNKGKIINDLDNLSDPIYNNIRNKITKYQGGYYYQDNGNPYEVLFFCEKDVKGLNIHKDCKILNNDCFINTKKITKVNFEGENIEYIGYNIFNEFISVEEVYIPDSIKIIKYNSNVERFITSNDELTNAANFFKLSSDNFINIVNYRYTKKISEYQYIESPYDQNVIIDLDNSSLSIEEYSILKTRKSKVTFKEVLKKTTILYINNKDINSNNNEFTCEYLVGDEYYPEHYFYKIIKDDKGIKTQQLYKNVFSSFDTTECSEYVYFLAILYYQKLRRDKLYNLNKKIDKNLLDFYSNNVLSSFNNPVNNITNIITNKSKIKPYEFLGIKNNHFYFRLDKELDVILIENKLVNIYSNISNPNTDDLLNYFHDHLPVYLNNNNINNINIINIKDLFKIELGYNKTIFNSIKKIKDYIPNLYNLLSDDIMDNINRTINNQRYLDALGNKDALTRKYLILFESDYQLENYVIDIENNMDALRKSIIESLPYLTPLYDEEIFKNVNFTEEELEQCIEIYNKYNIPILNDIICYQKFSENFFVNHINDFIKAGVDFSMNKNPWMAKDKISTRTKILLNLI